MTAQRQIIPAVTAYTKTLADAANAVTAAGIDASVQTELLSEVMELLADARDALEVLRGVEAKATSMQAGKEQAFYYKDAVKTAMEDLRAPIDALEMIVDKSAWPIPTYGDLMFEV